MSIRKSTPNHTPHTYTHMQNEAFIRAIEDTSYKTENPIYDINKEKLLQKTTDIYTSKLDDLVGESYEVIYNYIISLLIVSPLYLFSIGGIYEIPTKELIMYILDCFNKVEADTIHIYFCRSGILQHALEKVIKSDNIDIHIEIKSFASKPTNIYTDVTKRDVDKKIDVCDRDKRILSIYHFPPLSKCKEIIKGLRTNKDNIVGTLFLGDIDRGICLPKKFNPLLSLLNMKLIDYGTVPTISCFDIHDPIIKEQLNKYLNLPFKYNFCRQLFYANKDMDFKVKPTLNMDGWNNYKRLNTLTSDKGIVLLVCEHTYFIKKYGVLWDMNLDAIPRLLEIVSEKLYMPSASFNGGSDGKQLPLDIYEEYFHRIEYIRYDIHRIQYIKMRKLSMFNKYVDIFPIMTMRTNILYRQRIQCEISTVEHFKDEVRTMYCSVCCKPKIMNCEQCIHITYCSEKCKIIDYELLNHKEECSIFKFIEDKQLEERIIKPIMTE
jgi:hypothetical protein